MKRAVISLEEGLEKPIHQTNVEEESDIEAVSETFFGDQADDLNEVVDSAQQSIPKENSSNHGFIDGRLVLKIWRGFIDLKERMDWPDELFYL
ncbi:hypothetical protein Tco_0591079 [Tanacetum coccineum]